MRKVLLICIVSLGVWGGISPVSGYERHIENDHRVVYTQKAGHFSFVPKKIIDSNNIYNKGHVDNYDDPYIRSILKAQAPFKRIKGQHNKTISIVFRDQNNKKNFLQEFGLGLFMAEQLTIKLYMLDARKISLPLIPRVFPFFVMGDRFVQGVINKPLLKGLIQESTYRAQKAISITQLLHRIKQKYNMNQQIVDVNYNKDIELFEVHKKGKRKINAFISKDGRYIILVD